MSLVKSIVLFTANLWDLGLGNALILAFTPSLVLLVLGAILQKISSNWKFDEVEGAGGFVQLPLDWVSLLRSASA